ncbi:phenylalanine--tRNA ligase subunit alpha [Peptostreptococcus equinus]|uniref:Phenylalanine--tRNA ligase alpha subunit n=1 Tax=Peptostreptococcus equinus TaxID=3003601 RepID=A0ABY7JUV6_9FIRM|nr:phenylalanine--tRNA ligase subunit alpha [Peptostreptococcus sp. CBA3647]WAW15502.1 phenylalanine--tRNA ligase subunit alpha [Peptostreptococcus sp. CBA3647]
MKEKLTKLREEALGFIEKAETFDEIEKLRVNLLGKKGDLTVILKGMGKLSNEERPVIGKLGNEVREAITEKINEKKISIQEKMQEEKIKSETIDITMPGKSFEIGKKHIISKMIDEVTEIFMGMGFSIADGPEIETVENNFDSLNAPKDHPSRDMSDTFYITEDILLRTQTSPVQIRTMKEAVNNNDLPLKIIVPGRCFRSDSPDATHSPMFHQIEVLVVGKDITFTEFKGTMERFVQKLFGPDTKTKFRPHNFPFTEPSAEIDVTCFKCGGKGCPVCKGEGWIEILGAGMVHPNVLRNCGIDPNEYSGFAAGMGVERLGMLKYGIDDIRLMFENDIRFLDQF